MHNDRSNQRKATIAAQYFLYFGVFGVYLPYFNLYCHHLGFSGIEIGVLSSLRSMVLVVFSIAWGVVADRFQIRKPIYVLCHWLSTAVWTAYFFSENYWVLLLVTAGHAVFYAPIISFMEAFTIDVLGEEKKSYGTIRVWGSLAFIGTVLLMGSVIDLFSIRIILWVVASGAVVHAFFSLKMPKITLATAGDFFLKAKAFLSGRAVVFLVCAFLMLVSHGMYYGFFSIYLNTLGYGSLFIGIAWALASIAEMAVMIRSKWIFKHCSYEKALMLSLGTAAVRWLLVGYASSPAAILALQCLHAVTYGIFHMASILYIDSLSPEETKTMGQAINNASTYGLGLMTGFFVSGFVYQRHGAGMGFWVSGVIALAAFALFTGATVFNPAKSTPGES